MMGLFEVAEFKGAESSILIAFPRRPLITRALAEIVQQHLEALQIRLGGAAG